MDVYVGDTRSHKMVRQLEHLGWGRILVDRTVTLYQGEKWVLDNGVYKDWVSGVSFDGGAYLSRLENFRAWALWPPDWLVLPEKVAGGVSSLDLSREFSDRFQAMGMDWPVALVLQDGMCEQDVGSALRDIPRVQSLFVGGTNDFKATAGRWVDYARDRGLCCHYGRCGTLRKARHALAVGVSSLDSAFPLWSKERFKEFQEAIEGNFLQGDLFYR